LPKLPTALRPLFSAVREEGGRALLVGGCVRDALRGEASKDLDIEVHRLPADRLLPLLRRFGRVDEVGRSFGVFKLRVAGVDLDVALPRRDRRAGPGHKGIAAESDPEIGEVEAARRRDLTVNAIAWDPLTGDFVDPFGGRSDLAARRLRAVDATTFGEDPLRALRVAQ
jgi:tRNA nucleotidyltransferase (CCA-adding enzyme)